MAGFTSLDNMISEVSTDGNEWVAHWNKNTFGTTAHTAGVWYCLAMGGGNPTANSMFGTGTNLSFQSSVDATATQAAILHGGNVDAAGAGFKHLLAASAFSAAATSMPAIFQLVDILGHYPITTVTTTGAQTLINSVTFTANAGTDVITHTGWDIESFTKVQLTTTTTLPAGLSLATDYWTVYQSSTTSKLATSLANAIAGTTIDITDAGTGTHTITARLPRYSTGAGVQAFLTPSTVMGAGTPTVTLGYTNSAGTASRATPSSPALPTCNTTSPVTQISYSGTGSGKFGPYLPLQAGDSGVQSCQSINFSATMTSGVQNLVLCKPIGLPLPMTTIGVAAERDYVNQLFSMPRIYDGANLQWLMYAGAATPTNSAFYGAMQFGWSN